MYGCISTGLIYLGIGVFALLSHYNISDRGADEGSMLAVLNNSTVGYILVCVILLGTLSFIIWRIFESIRDPYDYGNSPKAKSLRAAIGLSTLADILIVHSAVTALFGTNQSNEDGRPEALRETVTSILNHSAGEIIMILTGTIVLVIAIIQLVYGVTRGYKERLDISHLNKFMQHAIHFLGCSGYIVRGVMIGLIGFYFFKCGLENNPQLAINTDRAFEIISEKLGEIAFLLAAAGTIFYALFMFFFGVYYDTDKD